MFSLFVNIPSEWLNRCQTTVEIFYKTGDVEFKASNPFYLQINTV